MVPDMLAVVRLTWTTLIAWRVSSKILAVLSPDELCPVVLITCCVEPKLELGAVNFNDSFAISFKCLSTSDSSSALGQGIDLEYRQTLKNASVAFSTP